jgi:cysteine desulfurase/selenocysteine lyase
MSRLLERSEFGPLAGTDLIYFDSAATSLVPRRVVGAMTRYYEEVGAAAGRSAHRPAARATALVEDAREVAAAFLDCAPREVVFTKNATDGINLVAAGLPWRAGDRIVVTLFEHHANLLPWMRLREERGVELEVVPPEADGSYSAKSFAGPLARGDVKLVAFTHRSNVLGTKLPADEICAAARAAGALTLIDAAQSAPHQPIDFGVLDAYFLVMSGHKALGPKSAGVLLVRERAWETLSPARLGGGMVADVNLDGYQPAAPPRCYEAGTYDVASIAGMAEAFRILSEIGMGYVAAHDRALGAQLYDGLRAIPAVTCFGPQDRAARTGTCSFAIENLKPHRAASLYDSLGGIAVRSGHHCALPLATEHLGRREGTVRASLYAYNDASEITRFLEVTEKVCQVAAKGA